MKRTASSRSFGLLLTAVFVVVAVPLYWTQKHQSIYWIAAAAVSLLISLLIPRIMAPLKRLWIKLGRLLHVVVNPLILTTVFVLAFIPVGALVRLFGKDLLSLKRDPKAASYWIERADRPSAQSLKDPF
jgi:hypothetical protein